MHRRVCFYITVDIDYSKYLLNAPCVVPGTIPGACDTSKHKINKSPSMWSLHPISKIEIARNTHN